MKVIWKKREKEIYIRLEQCEHITVSGFLLMELGGPKMELGGPKMELPRPRPLEGPQIQLGDPGEG